MTRFSPTTTLILLLARPCAAQFGAEAAAFLDVPVGGRPAALGGAYSALASDAYAPAWNPAGLARAGGPQAAATHAVYLEDLSNDFVSIVAPFRGGHGFGASAQVLRSGDIPSTDAQGRETGTGEASYSAYTVSYGVALGERWSLGAAPKALVARLDRKSASAFAADVGAAYAAAPGLDLAAVAANLGGRLQGERLPTAIRLGGAYEAAPGLLASLEFSRTRAGSGDVRGGLEWSLVPGFAVRGGGQGGPGTRGWDAFTTGVGLALWGHRFDYAWVPSGALGSSHFASVVVAFGGRPGPAVVSAVQIPR